MKFLDRFRRKPPINVLDWANPDAKGVVKSSPMSEEEIQWLAEHARRVGAAHQAVRAADEVREALLAQAGLLPRLKRP